MCFGGFSLRTSWWIVFPLLTPGGTPAQQLRMASYFRKLIEALSLSRGDQKIADLPLTVEEYQKLAVMIIIAVG